MKNIKSNPLNPDNKLLNWEKWVEIRKEEIENLKHRTGRPAVDLTLNLHEKVRNEKEWKTVLQTAQISKKPTVRGALWEQPERLKQKCPCEPAYDIHRTPEELGHPRKIEHIEVPKYILETEKGVLGVSQRNNFEKLNSEYQKYKKKREGELKDKIRKIYPYRTENNNLLVKGNKPKPVTRKLPLLPTLAITSPEESSEEPLFAVYALRINNTIFIKDIPGQVLPTLRKMQAESWHESCLSWSYYFNVPVKRIGRAKLFLQNLGTVTLRYSWKRIKRIIPFIPEDPYEPLFFFNKNEDVLSPGQTREIYFTFVSENPGIYSESWEFSPCNVCFFDTLLQKFVVNLNADAVRDEQKNLKKIDVVKARINKKAVRKMIRQMVNETVEKAMTIEPQIYSYKNLFLESEMFVMKNPVCFYHQTEVMRLKEAYTEMMADHEWDLSITTWREAMMRTEYEERMKYYEFLRKTHIQLLKPWFEGEGLLEAKHRAVKIILSCLADKFDQEYLRLLQVNNVSVEKSSRLSAKSLTTVLESFTLWSIRNIFYIHMYQHVSSTLEACAGVISSLDTNRWIKFEFCNRR